MAGTLTLLGVGAGAGGVMTLLQDDFSEANGTNVSGKSLDVGGTWSGRNGGSAQVQSGQYAEQSSGGAEYLSDADAAQADMTAQADFVFPADNYDGGLVARLSDGSNYWVLLGEKVGGVDRLSLYEVNAGSATSRDSVNSPGLASGAHTLKLVCSGNTITGYLDGVQQVQYTSATFNNTATRFGLRNYRDGTFAQVPADNFLVTT